MRYPKYKYFYAVCDFIIIVMTLFQTKVIVSLYNQAYFNSALNSEIISLYIFIIISFVMILIFQANNLYKLNVVLYKSRHLTIIIRALFYSIISLVVLSFIIKFPFIRDSRLFVFTFALFAFINLLIIRVYLLRRIYIYLKKHKILTRNILIWGAGRSGKLLAAKILFEDTYGIKLIGFIDDFIKIDTNVVGDLNVVANKGGIEKLKKNIKIDEIIVAIDNIQHEKLLDILDECNRLEINVKLASQLFQIIPEKITTEVYSGVPVIDLSPRVSKNFNLAMKRIVDIVVSLVGLLILSPLLLIVSLLIRLSSEGPIIYKHIRIGKHGKPFMFYKFRSMKVCNDDDSGRKILMLDFMKNGNSQNKNDTKIVNNNRITKIGSFIRKTSIDELPQLLNVLKGDMSLVGPRPCLPYEYENYDEWQKRRLSVLPGCTGVWQVSGRSSVSFKDSVVLDIYYVSNMSPWLDLQLILKTIPVMLFARGGK